MPKYKISELNVGIHPKGEGIMDVNKLGFLEFNYPNFIALLVGYSLSKIQDYHEAIFEIYERDPKIHGGPVDAKMFVKIIGELDNPTFEIDIYDKHNIREATRREYNLPR